MKANVSAEVRRFRSRAVGAWFVVVLLIAACGSTLPQAQQGTAVVNGGEFGDLSNGTLPPGARINEKGEIVNAEGEVIGTAEDLGIAVGPDVDEAGSVGTSGPSGSSRKQGGPAPGVDGPGVTDRTITLGLYNLSETEAAQEAIGSSAVGSFDLKRGWQALIDYQNRHGGIAGRRINPVFFTFESASSESLAQQEQEECARWTQDNHVFAGLTYVQSSNILECMHEAGAVVHSLDSVSTRATAPLHRQYPFYVEPIALTLDRAAVAMVEGLHALRYFAGDERLGLVTFDNPSFRYATDKALMPALRRRGVTLADAAYLHLPATIGEYAQLSNDAANAALRFKSTGIDHVIFLDWGGAAAWLFMSAAEKQDYRPRYGFTSQSGNQSLAAVLGNDARNQLRRALSIGWQPVTDTLEAEDADRENPTRVLCLSIMRKAGVQMNGPAGQALALAICDGLWSLGAALQDATVINQTTYLAGNEGLRGAYQPASTWSTSISAHRHDGVSAVANLRFVDDCTCFRYLSRPYPIR